MKTSNRYRSTILFLLLVGIVAIVVRVALAYPLPPPDDPPPPIPPEQRADPDDPNSPILSVTIESPADGEEIIDEP